MVRKARLGSAWRCLAESPALFSVLAVLASPVGLTLGTISERKAGSVKMSPKNCHAAGLQGLYMATIPFLFQPDSGKADMLELVGEVQHLHLSKTPCEGSSYSAIQSLPLELISRGSFTGLCLTSRSRKYYKVLYNTELILYNTMQYNSNTLVILYNTISYVYIYIYTHRFDVFTSLEAAYQRKRLRPPWSLLLPQVQTSKLEDHPRCLFPVENYVFEPITRLTRLSSGFFRNQSWLFGPVLFRGGII